jgi:hypothetical protein
LPIREQKVKYLEWPVTAWPAVTIDNLQGKGDFARFEVTMNNQQRKRDSAWLEITMNSLQKERRIVHGEKFQSWS